MTELRLRLVLASTSPYRKALLERLGVPFTVDNPRVDETPGSGETPEALALRLACAKALAVAGRHANALVIGSDQVAMLGKSVLGKPGSHARAAEQLRVMSGKTVRFVTALCVHHSGTGRSLSRVVPYEVEFRALDNEIIERYLRREQPYDCAGSAKAEGLGIALIARMQGEDPNALIGLPLIALVDLLREQGMSVL
jgi:septum formation protein